MKLKLNKQNSSFKPVSLTIDFETPEELDSFRAMCQMDIRVSDFVVEQLSIKTYKDIQLKPVVLTTILGNIFEKLSWSKDN